ncbi:MAG TPA: aminotransferase class V-fold PLP-dependent enzyme, partial [Gemmatimonadales bacterium]|nr:aminotransferase class V-fold PLP-dependent enzyme [Gemmatimonadales bacterium]
PHILNMMIPGTRSEALLMHLDMAGIAASGGSACSTGTPEPSHVLSAMGFPAELAFGAVRLSLGRGSTAEDITLAIEAFPGAVTKVRKLTETLNRG